MIQIIQKEQEITNMFLEDTAQGDWVIKLGKADFEKVSIGRKPIIAVKAEDDKSIGELSEIAFDEIKKDGLQACILHRDTIVQTRRRTHDARIVRVQRLCFHLYRQGY